MSFASHSTAGTSTATEFVAEEFETEVPEERVEALLETIEKGVRQLRDEIVSDDRFEELLRSGPGSDILKENDSTEHGDPEPTTERLLIEPLFETLGYPDMATEVGDLSEDYGLQADYGLSLRDHSDIDSNRLLVEAEPINKKLDQESHGLGQVKDWLERDKFEADFGIATDGLRWTLIKYDRDTYMFDTLGEIDLQPLFLAAFDDQTGSQVGLRETLGDSEVDRVEDFIRTFALDNFLSIAGDAPTIIEEKREEITDKFYDEYVRLVFGVGGKDEDEPRARSLIGDGIDAPKGATGDDIRLFSVELMNRLIFLKFLEDRQLVRKDLLRAIRDTYDPETQPISLYKLYLEPLFFGVLNERPSDRSEQVEQVEFYDDIPYLNGGLFTPRSDPDVEFDDRDFDVRDSVLGSIIDLLERYSFSAEGTPTELDPSILGNVFEKTINHITGDAGDQKKSLGAYYTPDEITSFCAEETVRPGLLERFKTVLIEEEDWPEHVVDGYDEIEALIETLPPSRDLMDVLLEEVDQFRALDPACGSGHFLTSVQSEIVGIRKALYEKHPDDPPTWKLRKRTVIQNIYGVDIVSPAVEIAKLRLWLSIIGKVEPDAMERYDEDELALPNVMFNVQQGNSLIGYTDLMETTGEGGQMRVDAWGADTVRSKYEDIIREIQLHKRATEKDTAREHLLEAERLREGYRPDLNERVLQDFRDAGIEDITYEQVESQQPFHWVLEFAPVYADDGFDVIIGNPPWDALTPDRSHFFPKYDERFRTRSPREKDQKEEELLSNDDIAAEYEEFKQSMKIRSDYYNSSGQYKLQKPTVGGQTVATETDLSLLFFERVTQLAGDQSYVTQIMPGNFFLGATAKDLREYILNETELEHFVQFENKGIFNNIDDRYHFAICTFQNSGSTDIVNGGFASGDTSILTNFDERSVHLSSEVLAEYSPESRIFPFIRSQELVDSLSKFVDHPPIGEQTGNDWFVSLYMKELDRANDSDLLMEQPEDDNYPIYEGKNIHQFAYDDTSVFDIDPISLWGVDEDDSDRSAKHRVRMKNYRSRDPDASLKKAIYNKFDGSGSQKSFVNDLLEQHGRPELSKEDVLLDCTKYRIAIRKITNSTNERTLIAGVIPKNTVTVHSIATVRPHVVEPTEDDLSNYPMHSAYEKVFADEELFVVLGLLNSIPIDYLMRTKIDTNIVQYKFEESQMPRLTQGDDWFEYIWTRAARLNCYGEAFEEMRDRLGGIDPATDEDERKRLQAEIDAAAFHAYGLDRDEAQFILDDFHRVQNPRLMTEDYFNLILEKYEELAG